MASFSFLLTPRPQIEFAEDRLRFGETFVGGLPKRLHSFNIVGRRARRVLHARLIQRLLRGDLRRKGYGNDQKQDHHNIFIVFSRRAATRRQLECPVTSNTPSLSRVKSHFIVTRSRSCVL
jgi:hypothetical protein